MLQAFTDFTREQHLFSAEQEVLLAVSGGRDSVALADLMHRAGYAFAVAHCNFHLRHADSDRDQAFVEALATRYGVPFHTVDFNTREYASQHGLSIEEAARQLRYDYFEALRREHHYACIATAHHRDDSVETFFLNLFRGTGIAGLHGIRPRVGHIVRPMLCFSRADIDRYIARQHLAFVEDYTNAQLDARRNRIRMQLMPLLRSLYPEVDSTMQQNIERLYDTELVYKAHIESLRSQLVKPAPSTVVGHGLELLQIAISDVATLSPQRTLLFELLRPYGFSASTVDDLLASLSRPHSGKLFLSSSHALAIDRHRLLIAPRCEPISPRLIYKEVQPADFAKPSSPSTIIVDAATVEPPLRLRPWQPGDRFMPFGMKNMRLVSDLLSDLKINRLEKAHVHLLVDASDRIVWVVGIRADNRFRLTDASQSAWAIEVLPQP